MTTKNHPISFLQRFQGKKSTISKEGLLHLFNNHVPSSPSRSSDVQKNITSKQHLQSLGLQIIRSESQKPKKQPPSSRLSYRTQALRKGQESRDFMLPKVRSKFNNSHQSLYNSQGRPNETERVLKKVDNQAKITSSSSKGGYLMNKNMDVAALEHLQLLTKLQEKLVSHGKDRR